ncbi:MAG: pyridoxamine 5'-phosphate oxidase family protein [Candidatus Limnocylindrales bacterium]
MRETAEDLARLQALLDRSYEAAGAHLRGVITPERRLTAEQLAERLPGMCLLALATATADGRPINGPVDGFFYRGEWYFGSSHESLRFRHIRQRPAVSATYLPGEELSVTTHGRAHEVDASTHDDGGFAEVVIGYYGPRFDGAEALLESSAYARIEAERMFTFHLDPAEAAGLSS